jgi:ABC-2 type transport system permease protein
MSGERFWRRLGDELAQMWVITVKDMRVYYLTPPMLMFGLMLPIFLFFSFSIKRNLGPEVGLARLLALTVFFTSSSAGAVIVPLERRMRTFDRLLAAPVSLVAVLMGKILVGVLFGLAVSIVLLLGGLLLFHTLIAQPWLLAIAAVLAACSFSALGLLFASWPTQSVGSIMMPSTLLRWPLLFISGVFIPLDEMAPWTRALSYCSPLTYAQDLLSHALLGGGVQNILLDVAALILSLTLFLTATVWLHRWSRELGY